MVTPAPLTVTALDVTKVYGETPALTGFTTSTLANGETVGSVTLNSAGQVATASVAGSPYAVTPSNATGGTFAPGNYNIRYVNGALVVTPAPLTVTALDVTKVYGETPALTGFTTSALVNGETVGSVTLNSAGQVATASVAGSPYAVTPSNATGGTFAPGNYNISYVNGVLTVTAAPVIPPVVEPPVITPPVIVPPIVIPPVVIPPVVVPPIVIAPDVEPPVAAETAPVISEAQAMPRTPVQDARPVLLTVITATPTAPNPVTLFVAEPPPAPLPAAPIVQQEERRVQPLPVLPRKQDRN